MQVLLDTGPWVALIDRSESKHPECVTWLKGFEGEIFSTEAVFTEVLYLLNFSFSAQSAAFNFILNGAVSLVPSSLESLGRANKLMEKYYDLPMDFADATLVCLAQDLAIKNIVTFDKKHFSIYRLQGRETFIVLP
jgi:predicted nucleic acid-binding protein